LELSRSLRTRAPAGARWPPSGPTRTRRGTNVQALRFPALRPGHGLGVCQSRQSLVTFGRQQQTFQVALERVALGAGAEEIIEALGVVFKWTGSRAYGVASSHGEAPPQPLEHGDLPTAQTTAIEACDAIEPGILGAGLCAGAPSRPSCIDAAIRARAGALKSQSSKLLKHEVKSSRSETFRRPRWRLGSWIT
jgi:hypothetical protein